MKKADQTDVPWREMPRLDDLVREVERARISWLKEFRGRAWAEMITGVLSWGAVILSVPFYVIGLLAVVGIVNRDSLRTLMQASGESISILVISWVTCIALWGASQVSKLLWLFPKRQAEIAESCKEWDTSVAKRLRMIPVDLLEEAQVRLSSQIVQMKELTVAFVIGGGVFVTATTQTIRATVCPASGECKLLLSPAFVALYLVAALLAFLAILIHLKRHPLDHANRVLEIATLHAKAKNGD